MEWVIKDEVLLYPLWLFDICKIEMIDLRKTKNGS